MPGHAKPFPGCRYGPMALRPLLRSTLQPGERLIGFGAADTASAGWRALILFAPALPVGSMWSHRFLRRRRVLVLTDRRLMVLPPDQPQLNPRSIRWNAEYPLSQIRLQQITRHRVRFSTQNGSLVARLRGHWAGADLSTARIGPQEPGIAR